MGLISEVDTPGTVASPMAKPSTKEVCVGKQIIKNYGDA